VNQEDLNETGIEEPEDALRREALARLGALSAVTSSTVLTLLLSDKASAQSGILGPPPPPPPPGGGEG